MTRKVFKGILIGLLVLFVITIALHLILAGVIKHKINTLDDEERIYRTEGARINMLTGKIVLKNISVHARATQKDSLAVRAENALLTGIGIRDFFNTDVLQFATLHISRPEIAYYKRKKPEDSKPSEKKKPVENTSGPEIQLANLYIDSGRLTFFEENKDTVIHIKSLNLGLSNLRYNAQTKYKNIPFAYQLDSLRFHDFFYGLNELENLKIAEIKGDSTYISSYNAQIIPKYDKVAFQKHLEREKDRITLQVDTLNIKNYNITLHDGLTDLYIDSLEVKQAGLELYRNKQMPDQIKYKPLYSQMLRELPFHLQVNNIDINRSKISYIEQMDFSVPGGVVSFSEFNASITGINNDKNFDEDTRIAIDCKFMASAPLQVEWDFKINSKDDDFTIKGHLQDLDATHINSILIPNNRLKLSGKIQQMYFNFYGNNYVAHGAMKMAYDEFKVEVLEEDTNKLKKLISFVANILIDKDNTLQEKEEHIGDVQRDQQKSFFSYLWLCIKKGTVDTLL